MCMRTSEESKLQTQNTPVAEENSLRKQLLSILALSIAGGVIYLIPYMRYAFYDLQQQAMEISNTQIALLTTAYGIGCIILYIPGGILSDRTKVKGNIVVSLIAVSVLTVVYAFTARIYILSLIIWFLFALSTAFVFWGSLLKALRLMGNSRNQGLLFGLYYMGNGISGAAVNAISAWASDRFESQYAQFLAIVLIYATSTVLAAILVLVVVPKELGSNVRIGETVFDSSQMGALVRHKGVWLFSAITLTSYAAYSGVYYFTPYLTSAFDVSSSDAGLIASLRYAAFVIAPLSGFIADNVFKSTSRWFIFLYLTLGGLYFGVMYMSGTVSVAVATVYSLLPTLVAVSLYGIQFSIAKEVRIPAAVTATAIGIVSMIGYLPDFFMPPLFGFWLDRYGDSGYTWIFVFLGITCVVGAIVSLLVRRYYTATKLIESVSLEKAPISSN